MRMHDTDGVSLAFGLVFIGIAGLWAASRVAVLAPAVVGWFMAGSLVLVGGAGIVHAVRRRHADDPRS